MVSPKKNLSPGSTTDSESGFTADPAKGRGTSRRGRKILPEFHFPEGSITRNELVERIASDDLELRNRTLSDLLCYAPWAQIWELIEPQEALEALPDLDLPEALAKAWSSALAEHRSSKG